jgi:hypothetical protein
MVVTVTASAAARTKRKRLDRTMLEPIMALPSCPRVLGLNPLRCFITFSPSIAARRQFASD